MKLKIKIKKISPNTFPEVIDKGEWVDLKASKDIVINPPIKSKEKGNSNIIISSTMIPLGVAMKLPKGFEAIIAPRSSSYNKFGIIQTNSFGVIDNSYSGNNDEWKMPVVALKPSSIKEGDRVCQFRIQLSQKATVWQKLKWLLSSGIKLVETDNLDSNDRGGFGSTGVN